MGLWPKRGSGELRWQRAQRGPGEFFFVAVVEIHHFCGLRFAVVAPDACPVPGVVGAELGRDEITDFGGLGEGGRGASL